MLRPGACSLLHRQEKSSPWSHCPFAGPQSDPNNLGLPEPDLHEGPLPSRPSIPWPTSAPLQQPADPDHENPCLFGVLFYPAFLWPYELTPQKTRPGTSQRRYPSGQKPNVRMLDFLSIWEDTQIKILMQYYRPPNSVAQAGGTGG